MSDIQPLKEDVVHAGTIEDPIPQKLIFVKRDSTGVKKVYTLGMGGTTGGSEVSVSPATDTVTGIVKLTDDHTVDAPAATGSIAITPNGVKVAIEAAKTEITDDITDSVNSAIDDALQDGNKLDAAIDGAIDEAIQEGGKLDTAIDKAIKDSIADGSLDDAISGAVDDVVQDKIESGEIGSSGDGSSSLVLKPGIIAPFEGATNVNVMVQLQASAYKCLLESEQRLHREFEIATVAEPSETKFTKEINADTVSVDNQLDPQTQFKWRCRDVTVNGLHSAWTSWTTFTTGEGAGVDTPTLTVLGAPSSVPENPTLTGSEFSVHGSEDTHQCTDWQVIKGKSEVIWESLNDISNLTSIQVPNGKLQEGMQYTFKVRYKGASLGWSDWYSVSATTKVNFVTIAAPVLSVQGAPTGVPEQPILSGGAFTTISDTQASDTHECTDWQVVKVSDSSTVWESLNNSTNKTSIQVSTALQEGTQYKFRCRYKGVTYGWSDWAEVTASTAASFTGIATPVISVKEGTGDLSAVTYQTLFMASDPVIYDDPSDYIDKAEWILYTNKDNLLNKVWSEADSKQVKFLGCFTGYNFLPSTNYKLTYRQHAKNADTWTSLTSIDFTTAEDLKVPTIKFTMKNKVNFGKLCKWWDSSQLKVYVNGAPNEIMSTTPNADYVLSNEGDQIEIKNETASNCYPLLTFSMDGAKEEYYANLISIDAPLPTLTTTNTTGSYVTTLGGQGSYASGGSPIYATIHGYGIFAQCTSLISVPEMLFRYNPRVKRFDGTGGDGSRWSTNTNYNGGNGYGAFYNCTSLTSLPQDLFWYTPDLTNVGGTGGSGGAGKYYSVGGTGWGTFANCKSLTSLPSGLFKYNPLLSQIDGKGGDGDTYNGSNGYGAFYNCTSLTSLPSELFGPNYALTRFGAIAGTGAENLDKASSSGKGGDAYSAFYNCSHIAELPSDLFSNLFALTHIGGQGGNGGNANGYGQTGDAEGAVPNAGAAGNGGVASACFNNCALTSLPEDLFNNAAPTLTHIGGQGGNGGNANGGIATNLGQNGGNGGTGGDGGTGGAFIDGVLSLISLPKNIFVNCINIVSFGVNGKNGTASDGYGNGTPGRKGTPGKGATSKGVIINCSMLTPIVKIGSSNVTSAPNFAAGNSAKGTVYVPKGSTTAATFKGDSSANVNIIEEEASA